VLDVLKAYEMGIWEEEIAIRIGPQERDGDFWLGHLLARPKGIGKGGFLKGLGKGALRKEGSSTSRFVWFNTGLGFVKGWGKFRKKNFPGNWGF